MTSHVAPGWGGSIPFDVPVDPDAPEALRWLRDELAKAPYQAARPTWFDRLSRSFLDWLGSLTGLGGEGVQGWIPGVVVLLVAAALITGFFIFGVPRLNRARRGAAVVFGESDRRTASDLRGAARRAAASGNWNLAVEEIFRALARSLEERTVVRPLPGTTAHDLATRAAALFPAETQRLEAAARAFDSVRYLGQDAREADYESIARLDGDLRLAPMPGVSTAAAR